MVSRPCRLTWHSPDQSGKRSDRSVSQAARPADRHRLAATRWPARWTRSSFRAWVYSRSPSEFGPGVCPSGFFSWPPRAGCAVAALCFSTSERNGRQIPSPGGCTSPPSAWRHTSVTATIASAAAMARAGARDPEAIAPDLAFAHPASKLAESGTGTHCRGRDGVLRAGRTTRYEGADVRRRYVATMAKRWRSSSSAGDQVVLVGGDRVDVDVARDVRAAVLAAVSRLARRRGCRSANSRLSPS